VKGSEHNMTFRDEDLSAEVANIFNEAQSMFGHDAAFSEVLHGSGGSRAPTRLRGESTRGPYGNSAFNAGFRVFNPDPPRTARLRLLQGERPKLGGRGRPPTRWFKIAAELGIELAAPIARVA
jgi:hypothetical protein